MRKVWEAVALFIVVIVLIGIVSEAIAPYMPIIGIVSAGLILLSVLILLFRLVYARRKFW
ncbi:hypothetical protein NG701_07400 [Pseudarthrobacter sp. HLT3-5]|uniref:hypothetical protein n=1 Tax=Pseudarthrobacter cellobiosi TaxID=2953654 RepID=UPI00208EB9AA|nr:hypothetical protein [Pseudarthrobacter sp. HLT3-5]MCO4274253.1 hypothetical protein [Pseudarthrobacter sp. HLT3-5]